MKASGPRICVNPCIRTCVCTPACNHLRSIDNTHTALVCTCAGTHRDICAYTCAHGLTETLIDILFPRTAATTLVFMELKKMADATRLYSPSSPLSKNHHKVHWSWCNSFSHFKIVAAHMPLLQLSLHVLKKIKHKTTTFRLEREEQILDFYTARTSLCSPSIPMHGRARLVRAGESV